jgi:hypothetical protein
MSHPGDYDSEMLWTRAIDDTAIENLLAGDTEDLVLAEFVSDARCAAAGPVPAPSAQLSSMFSPTVSPSTPAGDSAVSGPTTRRRRMPIPALLATLPFAAKAALGVGVAVAAVGGAGAAGVLPGPVNNAVANVISAVTPFDVLPNNNNDRSDFGEGVSNDARDETPGVDGADVSTNARTLGGALINPGASGTPGQPQVPAELPGQASNGAATGDGITPNSAQAPVPAPPVSGPAANDSLETPPVSAPPVVIPSAPTSPGRP